MNNEEKFQMFRRLLQICFEHNGRETSSKKKIRLSNRKYCTRDVKLRLEGENEKICFF